MIDTEAPYSAGWWLRTLAKQLQDRRIGSLWTRQGLQAVRQRPGLDLLDDYKRGDPPLGNVADGWRAHFQEIARMGRLNVADLVVSAKANRMQLRDFRTAAATDELGDVQARAYMRATGLPLVARDVHETMLTLGDSYAIVTPPDKDRSYPLVTAEDPRQVITAHDDATGKVLAALKLFRDEWDSTDFAYLYLPGKVLVATKGGVSAITDASFRMSRSWEWDDTKTQTVPGGLLPVVRFRNRGGVGEFEPHLDTLDRINDKILDISTIAKVQAFRQRAVKNLPETTTTVDEAGNPVEVDIDYTDAFVAAPGAMWQVPGDVDFWESQPTDLGPIRMAVKDDLEHLAAVTSTPLHTVTPDAASGSAEGASLMREAHVYAVEDRRDRVIPSWAELMSLVFTFAGDTGRADRSQIDALFGPMERYSLSEKMSAATQAKAAGLPQDAIYTDVMQYAPAEVPNLRAMQAADLLLAP